MNFRWDRNMCYPKFSSLLTSEVKRGIEKNLINKDAALLMVLLLQSLSGMHESHSRVGWMYITEPGKQQVQSELLISSLSNLRLSALVEILIF